MQTLYNSDSFVVVSFEIPAGDDAPAQGSAPAPLQRGGFEIVDKQSRKEIFIEGALAEHFKQGVQALVAAQTQGDEDALQAVIDDYIAGYTALAQQPVVLH
jgi:Protein of unknown function (DUF3567)